MSADPTLDALIPAGGGGDPLQGAIAAVERAGKVQDIDILNFACTLNSCDSTLKRITAAACRDQCIKSRICRH